MGLFFLSNKAPKRELRPDDMQKKAFFRFFEILFRKIGTFAKANVLYVLAMIPTGLVVFVFSNFVFGQLLNGIEANHVGLGATYFLGGFLFCNVFAALWGMGPATAGMTYLMRNYAREEHAWVWSDFKDATKFNFKQALCVFGIDMLVACVFYVMIVFYAQVGGTLGLVRYMVYIIIVLYSVMHLYIYPMMVTFDLSLKELYCNAFIFGLSKLPTNLFMVVVLAGVHILPLVCMIKYGGAYFPILLPLLLIAEWSILHSLSAFLQNFFVYPKLKKHMMDTEEENSQ